MAKMLPKNDLCFKMIFGDRKHKRLLIHFLNCIVESDFPIKEVDIEQTELTPDFVSGKWSRLDVLATTEKGEKINVEVQLKDEDNIIPRTLFYWSKMYSQQLPSGNDYCNLKRTVSVIIINFKLFGDGRFWHKCHIIDDESKERLTNLMELHFLELKKMRQVSATNPITVWLEFLKNPYSENVAKYEKTIPELKEAKELYGKINSDKKAQELWRLREKAIYDEASAISAAERRGIAEGKRETALSMLRDGMPIKTISKYTGLSESEIRSISGKPE